MKKNVANVSTVFAGMGSFTFVPEEDNEYFFMAQSADGVEKRFKLPAAQKTRTLNTAYRNSHHYIVLQQSPGLRERVTATITIPPYMRGEDGEGLPSHLSVAVTDDADITVDTGNTIQASLLLSSELRGYIE